MNPPAVWTYLALVVAFLILLWAVVEIRSRLTRSRHQEMKTETLSTWVRLDSTSAAHEDPLPLPEEESEDLEENAEQEPSPHPHPRAQQNGHYSQSKKLL